MMIIIDDWLKWKSYHTYKSTCWLGNQNTITHSVKNYIKEKFNQIDRVLEWHTDHFV